jgi:hypothetical protein
MLKKAVNMKDSFDSILKSCQTQLDSIELSKDDVVNLQKQSKAILDSLNQTNENMQNKIEWTITQNKVTIIYIEFIDDR